MLSGVHQRIVATPMAALFITPAAKYTSHALHSGEHHYTQTSQNFQLEIQMRLVPTSPARLHGAQDGTYRSTRSLI